jgi:hypothetical protein
MTLNLQTKELFTDAGQLIKKMHCPLHMQWEHLPAGSNPHERTCTGCSHPIYDTAFFSDAQLLTMVQHNPGTCLKIDIDQDNLQIKTHA